MRSFFKKERLLQDVLREGNYEEFRRAVFKRTRRELRGRRRQVWPWVSAAAAMLALGIFIGREFVGGGLEAGQVAESAAQEMVAHGEKEGQVLEIVETVPLPDAMVVRSVARQSVLVSTDPRGLPSWMVVRSRAEAEVVNDQELLALFPNQPVGFVMNSSGERLFVMGGVRAGEDLPQMR